MVPQPYQSLNSGFTINPDIVALGDVPILTSRTTPELSGRDRLHRLQITWMEQRLRAPWRVERHAECPPQGLVRSASC